MFSKLGLFTSCLLSISLRSALAQSNANATPGTANSSPMPATSNPAAAAPVAATSNPAASISTLAAGLSTSCQTSAGSLLTSEFGSCANIIGLASVIAGSGSIVPPLNNWISAICSADPCSNSTLSSAQQTIFSGCNADVQKGSAMASGLSTIISNYGTVRDVLCTQYVSNSTFCVPSILENVQNATAQNLTLTSLFSIISSGLSSSSFAKFPSSTYCNDCGHAIVALSGPLVASANASMTAAMAGGNSTMPMSHNSTSDGAEGVCGASFKDGKVPSSVRVAAKGSSSSAASAAKNSAGTRETVSFTSVIFVALVSSFLYYGC